jgi:hypothetical protein
MHPFHPFLLYGSAVTADVLLALPGFYRSLQILVGRRFMI